MSSEQSVTKAISPTREKALMPPPNNSAKKASDSIFSTANFSNNEDFKNLRKSLASVQDSNNIAAEKKGRKSKTELGSRASSRSQSSKRTRSFSSTVDEKELVLVSKDEIETLNAKIKNLELEKAVQSEQISILKSVQQENRRFIEILTEKVDILTKLSGRIDIIESVIHQKQSNISGASETSVITSEPDITCIPKTQWTTVINKSLKNLKTPEKMPKQQIEVINSVMSEQMDREKRKKNVLVFGLETKGEDKNGSELMTKINQIFHSIGLDPKIILRARRFRAKENGAVPPVFIQLKEEVDRNTVLSAARSKKLNEGVYLKPDLTEAERELEKQLRKRRDELNVEAEEGRQPFRWVIRGENIIKRYRQQQTCSNSQDHMQH